MLEIKRANHIMKGLATKKNIDSSTILILVSVSQITVAASASTMIPMSETVSTTEDDGEIEIRAEQVTEQIMNPNISVVDVPDVDESTDLIDPYWNAKDVIRDVAYFIRAHKFQDYDRRYYKNIDETPRRLYEEFPKPPLRSLHWEVRKHCDTSFVECLKYLERIVKLTALRREDDTVTVMKEQKWNLANNTQQILAVQRDCQMAQRRDNLTMVPFQGPIERFQWRTTVSYYMCWYTMLGVKELTNFDESCANHANCLDEFGTNNRDPRADDTKPFACALYSFCPDHCCPMKHIWYTTDCFQSRQNPCYAINPPGRRKCALDRDENRDFQSLVENRINVSCDCPARGYEWSSRFGLCVDVNECTSRKHNCTYDEGESCINLPGGFECICRFGYVYSHDERRCVHSTTIANALGINARAEETSKIKGNATVTKSLFGMIVETIRGSSSDRSVPRGLTTILCLYFAYA